LTQTQPFPDLRDVALRKQRVERDKRVQIELPKVHSVFRQADTRKS
jgi:hypothetical protein